MCRVLVWFCWAHGEDSFWDVKLHSLKLSSLMIWFCTWKRCYDMTDKLPVYVVEFVWALDVVK